MVDAVKVGKFTIYPINRAEEGLEILTGMSAGELKEDGTYPEGTINYLVAKRFEEIREALKGKKEKDDDEEKEKGKKKITHETDGMVS